MADKMLIDATHPEETRVVVLRGNRVEEFDFESANRKQLRGNIYLAKVTRVEPSLQAAFIDYGGNRHGFLAFSEIHPDYYQIPVADRQALLAQEERDAREAEAEADSRASRRGGGRNRHRRSGAERSRDPVRTEQAGSDEQPADDLALQEITGELTGATPGEIAAQEAAGEAHETATGIETPAEPPAAASTETPSAAQVAAEAAPIPTVEPAAHDETEEDAGDAAREAFEAPAGDIDAPAHADDHEHDETETGGHEAAHDSHADAGHDDGHDDHAEEEHVESVGGADALEEAQERAPRNFRRNYKIQEVIKRRQVMLVQVVKEERGSKGAALTTYLSLAGRYSVLMPNTARGGGISRKISSGEDRSRLKEIMQELEVPEGMGVILRTAGASRTKLEVKRDFEYLLRLWETVRDLTLKSMAPTLVYEEGSLTKRSIRDLYSKDIEEIIVSGEQGYKEAREFMRMLMPSHAKQVKFYNDAQPLFTRYGIESQLDAMFSPTVQLRSGGYIVINQTEALVAIDVNSGRATREHHIEDTAVKTNCEAADEVARQLRLRDLAGLIVIDFIDMDEGRNNRSVERRMKDALKHDRARIQVGRISHFGLLEMSRQRIRTSVLESSTEKCPVCGGSGHVRSVSSVALQLLRAVEETLNKGATHNLIVRTRSEVALYVLNHKRGHLRALEERFRITITISADATVNAQVSYIVDRGEQVHTPEAAKALAASHPEATSFLEAEQDAVDALAEHDVEDEIDPEASAEGHDHGHEPEQIETESDDGDGEVQARDSGGRDQERGEREGGRRRRRRGRGRGRSGEPREGGAPLAQNAGQNGSQDAAHEGEHAAVHEDANRGAPEEFGGELPHQEGASNGGPNAESEDVRRRRRRGRRGGRRNRHRNDEPNAVQGNGAPHQSGEGYQQAGFPPVSEEDASGIAPAFDSGAAAARPSHDASEAERKRELHAELKIEAKPAPQTEAAASPEAHAEAPRRRSTIREPAPVGDHASSAPAQVAPPPTPVVSSTAPETATPKRGWWGKRLLGN